MSWLEHHDRSWKLASDAEVMSRQNQLDSARELYMRAAKEEELAVNSLDLSKSRTLGISVVSAVSLWYKAARYKKAQQLAKTWLKYTALAAFAREELDELLQAIEQVIETDDEEPQEFGVSCIRATGCIKIPVADISSEMQKQSPILSYFQGDATGQNFHHRRHYRSADKKEHQQPDHKGAGAFKLSDNEYLHKKPSARSGVKNKRSPKTSSYFCFR
ncbi:hypothetical protein MBAV_000066 [Candidatus Magnetobacterium bavaricum]|uniref:Uncharacterized protein n=1 Tax=Candidatus Magnetobacterium bavaricum TaxID=29290 RepID=A0A0F3H0S3_9BACT|nr:hypothetical protein MBAV_000066 [Candidatus Magnetobacterium bavaricum]